MRGWHRVWYEERMRAVVLAIGGLDPGGGAGIAADVRAIHEGGGFAAPVTAVLTVQSTRGLVSAISVDALLLRKMIDEVVRNQNVRAVKCGALGSPENVRVVRRLIEKTGLPLVLDPVRIPTRGTTSLASPGTFDAVVRELFPMATVVTPNVPEAEAILGRAIRSAGDAERAARDLQNLGSRMVLLKGGHLHGARCVDFVAWCGGVTRLSRARRPLRETHGGGCYLASLLATEIAKLPARSRDGGLSGAVRRARRRHARALFSSESVGGPLAVLVR